MKKYVSENMIDVANEFGVFIEGLSSHSLLAESFN